MDNKFISQIKRGLKITTSYLMAVLLFVVFLMPVLSFAKENTETAVFNFSIVIFLFLFNFIYVEMRTLAFKEKRPQYNINPPSYKGILYGIIGIIPPVIIQLIIMLIKFPEEFSVLKRRIYQGFSGPLYWLSKLMGDEPAHYILSFLILVVISGLGYYAGYRDFLLTSYIRQKLGIKRNKTPGK